MHAGPRWIASNFFGGDISKLSALGLKAAALLWDWAHGIYHIDPRALERANWGDTIYVSVGLGSKSQLSTYDFDELTRLVFLAHDHCVRVALTANGTRGLRVVFTPRTREGCIMTRHPTIEQALAKFRESHPAPEESATTGLEARGS